MRPNEQVSNDGHQMSLSQELGPKVCSHVLGNRARKVPMSHVLVGGGGGGCTVTSNTSWVMVTWDPHVGGR